jgi:hypothetical protein
MDIMGYDTQDYPPVTRCGSLIAYRELVGHSQEFQHLSMDVIGYGPLEVDDRPLGR